MLIERLRRRSMPEAPDGPDIDAAVRLAQFSSYARMVPMMYGTLMVNAWMMAIGFLDHAPAWKTWIPALALTLVCGTRIVHWVRRDSHLATDETAVVEFRRTRVAACLAPALICLWALSLFRHGDDLLRSHVVFFLGYTIISTMLCLVHVPGASLRVAAFGGLPFLAYFALSGRPGLVGISVDVALVSTAVLVAIQCQSRDFARLVHTREEARRREREQLRLTRMMDDLPIPLVTVDRETLRIDYVNRASIALAQRVSPAMPALAGPLVGLDIAALHPDLGPLLPRLRDPSLLPHTARYRLGGEIVELQVSAVLGAHGDYIGPMLSWAVVTKQVEAERRIRQLAHYDSLTQLLNRHAFHERMDERLGGSDPRATVLMLDLDGFKAVNDTLGHRVGDELLTEVARRLGARCRHPDGAVARLGGDEFAVLVPGDDAAAAEALAMALVSAVSMPYALAHKRLVRIGVSVGIALAPGHGTDGETLIARADIALYVAKGAGKGRARVFVPEMYSRARRRAWIEARLRAALDTRSGLFVFYQPVVDLASGRATSREALIRWHHPRRGWVAPSEFLDVAEGTGLIDRIGAFVLDTACADAALWRDGGAVSVNVSAVQLGRGTLVPAVRQALATSGLAPDRLELEFAEFALARHGDATDDLNRLRELGVRLALDDYGTGNTSLARLRHFRFDSIKIDGSLVTEAIERPDGAAVLQAIVSLGRRLGVRMIAEGIETPAALDCVRREGCREAQGFLLGRPAPRPADAAAVRALDELPVATTNAMFLETTI